jgi:hypothetical protein
MPSVYSISDFLHAFEGVYETLDVRAAVVLDKDKEKKDKEEEKEQWLLVALSAHVRIASSHAAIQEFQDSTKRFGAVDFSTFRIVQQCYPIAETKQFFQEIGNGDLILHDLWVRLSEPCDILTMAGSVRVDHHDALARRWPRIEQQRQIAARDPNARQLLLNNADILRDTEMAGYENPHVAVKTLLDIDFGQSSESGGIWIACDIPVRLLPPEATRNGKEFRLKLRAEAHPAIKDVSCTIRRIGGAYGSSILQQSVIQLTPSDKEENPASWSGEIQLPIEREDQVTLEILSHKVGKLYSTGIRPFDLLPIEQTNPLLVALRLFCPPEELNLLLQESHKAKVELTNITNVARLFEVSIQWLLSVLGFRAIWLHKYERLKDANMDYGTIDCLAYKEDEDLLLLVNCSLAAPDPSELNRHEDLMTRLSNQLFPDSRVKVRSALFTTSHQPEAKQHNTRGSAVRVFFKEEVDQLLRMAEAGQTLEYLRFASPLFPDL